MVAPFAIRYPLPAHLIPNLQPANLGLYARVRCKSSTFRKWLVERCLAGIAEQDTSPSRQIGTLSQDAGERNRVFNHADVFGTKCRGTVVTQACCFMGDPTLQTFIAFHGILPLRNCFAARNRLGRRKPMSSSIAGIADRQHYRNLNQDSDHGG